VNARGTKFLSRVSVHVYVLRTELIDCEMGFPMPDLGEMAVKACYSSFRKHSIEIHGLNEDDLADSRMFLDLNKWTLTLLKRAIVREHMAYTAFLASSAGIQFDE
jgi:hypothetical protein